MDLEETLSAVRKKCQARQQQKMHEIESRLQDIDQEIHELETQNSIVVRYKLLDLRRQKEKLEAELEETLTSETRFNRDVLRMASKESPGRFRQPKKGRVRTSSRRNRGPELKRKFTRARTMTKKVQVCGNTDTRVGSALISDELAQKYAGSPPPIYFVKGNMCEVCGEDMQQNQEKSVMVCKRCGTYDDYIESSSKAMTYSVDDVTQFSSFSYRRQNHMSEILNSFQAKESTIIPDEVYASIMEKLHELRITDPAKITNKIIKSVLKTLNLRKYYENITLIRCVLTGQSPPRLTPQQEMNLKLMFEMANASFEQHCPMARKNFLSYHYCAYKMLELLELKEFLPYFNLLKGREKLWQQDNIWRKICKDCQWQFIASV